jgi:hypothetical protein
MKRLFAISILFMLIVSAFAGCTSQRSGCSATKGMGGYGH